MNDVVFFELNNWFAGRDYPLIPFITENLYKFSDDEWCKQNRLCVVTGPVDMSKNWCVTASRDWVEANCPQLLTDEEYSYSVILYRGTEGQVEKIETKKYSDFLRYPDPDAYSYVPEGRWAMEFLEYDEKNFGVKYQDTFWIDQDFDEDDEGEE